jgi:hypothetical protein
MFDGEEASGIIDVIPDDGFRRRAASATPLASR